MSRLYLPSQTNKQFLIDHPLPGQLSRQENPLIVLREQALTHEKHRLECVAELFSLIGIMTARGVLSGNENISVGKAIFQYGKGDREMQIQAAHCLPGQVKFDARPIHTAQDWRPGQLQQCQLKPLPLDAKLRNNFGRTDFADQSVNQADSFIEIMDNGRGLKPDLGRSVNFLQQHLKHRKIRDWQDVGEIVSLSVEQYRLLAANACEMRLNELQRLVMSDQAARRKSTVLENYLQTVQDRLIIPDAAAPQGFLREVADVVVQGVGPQSEHASR